MAKKKIKFDKAEVAKAIEALKNFCLSAQDCKNCPVKDSCTTYDPELKQRKGTTLPCFWVPNSEDKALQDAARLVKRFCGNSNCEKFPLTKECFTTISESSYAFAPCDWGKPHDEKGVIEK